MRHNFISIVLLQQWRRVAVTPAQSVLQGRKNRILCLWHSSEYVRHLGITGTPAPYGRHSPVISHSNGTLSSTRPSAIVEFS